MRGFLLALLLRVVYIVLVVLLLGGVAAILAAMGVQFRSTRVTMLVAAFALIPVGIAVYCASQKWPEITRAAHKIFPGATRACPFCAERIKREAIVCRYCGRDLPRA